MHNPRSILTPLFVFSLIFVCSSMLHAQQVEPSYDVSLQLVIGSNETAEKTELPADLSAVTRQLKTRFAFSNYRLANTILCRISNAGNFEYKSAGNIFGQQSNSGSPTFLESTISGFKSMPTAKGQPGFEAQAFRFGARVPIITGNYKDDVGKVNSVINYEQIGVTAVRLGLPQNVPTLIGTLNLPGTTGTIFLIMTVRSAD